MPIIPFRSQAVQLTSNISLSYEQKPSRPFSPTLGRVILEYQMPPIGTTYGPKYHRWSFIGSGPTSGMCDRLQQVVHTQYLKLISTNGLTSKHIVSCCRPFTQALRLRLSQAMRPTLVHGKIGVNRKSRTSSITLAQAEEYKYFGQATTATAHRAGLRITNAKVPIIKPGA